MTDLQETLIRCSMCWCKKLPQFYKVRENTGIRYKTCIVCGVRSKWKRDHKAKDMKWSQCAYTTNHAGALRLHIKTVHNKIKDFECEICASC